MKHTCMLHSVYRSSANVAAHAFAYVNKKLYATLA